MIAAEDLMIGSIFWDDYGGYNVVTSINCNKVGEAPNTVCAKHIKGGAVGNFSCNDIKAIPLSQDVMDKVGFEFINSPNIYGWYLDVGNRLLCWCHSEIVSLEFKKGQNDEYQSTIFDFDCKYLHQLQNICKVFGKDLKFKTT